MVDLIRSTVLMQCPANRWFFSLLSSTCELGDGVFILDQLTAIVGGATAIEYGLIAAAHSRPSSELRSKTTKANQLPQGCMTTSIVNDMHVGYC